MEKYRSSLGVTITGGLSEEATAWAGAALLVELYRKTGVEAATERALPKKKSSKGLRQGQMQDISLKPVWLKLKPIYLYSSDYGYRK